MSYRAEPQHELQHAHVGVRLRALRGDARVSIRRAAQRAGVSKSTWAAVEAGDRTPSVAVAEKMAAAVGVELGLLMAPQEHYTIRALANELSIALSASDEIAAEFRERSQRGEGVFLEQLGDDAMVLKIGHPDRRDEALELSTFARALLEEPRDSLMRPPA